MIRHRRVLPLIYALTVLALVLAACGGDNEPPHYGAFLKQGGDLVELTEMTAYSVPRESELDDVPTTADSQPTVILWRPDTRLEYLQLFSVSSGDELRYTASPKDEGILELQPSQDLEPGGYCYLQGDPLGLGLPAWCFEVGGTSTSHAVQDEEVAATEVPENLVWPFQVEMAGRRGPVVMVNVLNVSDELVFLRMQNAWPVKGSVGSTEYDYWAKPAWNRDSETHIFPGFRRVILVSLEQVPKAATDLSLRVEGVSRSNEEAGVWLTVPEDDGWELAESTDRTDEPRLGEQARVPGYFAVTAELLESDGLEVCVQVELTNEYGQKMAYNLYVVDPSSACELEWDLGLNDPTAEWLDPASMYIEPLASDTQYYRGECRLDPEWSRLVIAMNDTRLGAFASIRLN